ncbi:NACHT and WD repeat domain-containing protein 2-like [Centruroides sculpturatus]|uniref:NACHT and WD repeat domain-containing protein 2-like n=1 Tax=Centruroides sculpturatus TaxID=218467 RepID=UPI000C6EB835|nr:NACHT and WD repeat domain-containing protein 2-like [Centruroides sculpturatus]
MNFEHERKRIQEVLIPELQRQCNSFGIDIEILDAQYENDIDSTLDSIAFAHQLNEIEDGHNVSVGCFLVCLVGNKYKPYILPNQIDSNEFRPIRTAVIEAGLDVTLLDQWYKENLNLVPPAYVIQPVSSKYKKFRLRKPEDCTRLVYEQQIHEWLEEHEKLVKILSYGTRIALEEGQLKDDCCQHKLISGVHSHMKHALKLSKTAPERIICIVRQLEDINLDDAAAQNYIDVTNQSDGSLEEECYSGYREFLEDIVLSINRKNVYYFRFESDYDINIRFCRHS